MAQARDIPKFEDVQFPTFEVVTPHSGLNLTVRSLSVSQEERLKESSLSPAKATALLNQIIYECVTEKNKPIENLFNFEKNISLVDREAIVYGILVASYGEEQEFNITCSSCGHMYEIKENITENVEMKMYEGKENLITKNEEVELPISKFKAVLCLPTLYDEREFATSKGVSQDILRKADSYIIVKELHALKKREKTPDGKVDEDEDKKYLVVKNVFEIYSFMRNMPARDKTAIRKAWNDAYGDYGLRLKVRGVCPNCGRPEEFPVSLMAELFRLSQ